MCGFAELLEFVETLPEADLAPFGGKVEVTAMMERRPRRLAISSSTTPPPTESPIGTRARQECAILTIPTAARRSRRTTSSRSTVRRRRSPRRGLLRYGAWRQASGREGGERYRQAGLTVLKTLAIGSLFEPRPQPPGAGAAQPVPSSERLGLRAARPQEPLRRGHHVGRLPHARACPLCSKAGREGSVFDLLRTLKRSPAKTGDHR